MKVKKTNEWRRQKKDRNSINADKFTGSHKNSLLFPVGLPTALQTRACAHAIMLTVLQLAFIVFLMTEPADFLRSSFCILIVVGRYTVGSRLQLLVCVAGNRMRLQLVLDLLQSGTG
jgi:hypothetical protein